MSGAKNCPETPRQKMIGMMYLVLTAMLALNVSTDVLGGFLLIDKSLRSSITAFDKRNEALYDEFQYIYEQNPEKTKEWLDKALVLKQKSDSLYDYIQNFKYEMVKLADGDKTDPTLEKIEGLSNTDVTGTYGLVQGNAEKLQAKVENYRDYLIELVQGDSARINSYNAIFNFSDQKNTHGEVVDWIHGTFEGMPLGATVAQLTKIQNDVRSSESGMTNYLKSQTDALDFRVNKIEALVVPESKYVIQGSKYKAQIVLSAVDSTKVPRIFVNGQQLGEDGLYEVACPRASDNEQKYSGYIELTKNDGSIAQYPFESTYKVNEPFANISNPDLNVLYSSYDNKLNVSVQGVPSSKLRVSATGADVVPSGGLYIVRPKSGVKTVKIEVSGEVDGRVQSLGGGEYRVKPLQSPMAYLKTSTGENSGGKIKRKDLLATSSFLEAGYGADALLDVPFKIVGFTWAAGVKGRKVSGNKFEKADLDVLKNLSLGTQLMIYEIRVAVNGEEQKDMRMNSIPLIID